MSGTCLDSASGNMNDNPPLSKNLQLHGTRSEQNATKLLVIGSKSYEIDLKTHVVQDFYFPWAVVNSLAYMRTVNQFVIGFTDELATSQVGSTNKTTFRRGIFVTDIAVDEEENIIYVTVYMKPNRYDMCSVTQKGTNFKYLSITSDKYLKFDIDKKHKLVYVFTKGKVTSYTYQWFRIEDLVRGIGYIDAVVYNPMQDLLYFTRGHKLKMITKKGRESTVSAINMTLSMKTHANFLYMTALSVYNKICVVNIAGPLEFKIIKVPKTVERFNLCLF